MTASSSTARGDGWCELTSTEINKDFKELVGAEYTVKDLRTWAATLLAAAAFAERADGAGPDVGTPAKKVGAGGHDHGV